ncbi:MAG: alpha/beta hydrolase [Acidobacteria bacterium]|nr:alpha/beta hydrolase [Acidobacteriota bacterium]MXZ70642.1 alpha/beta hydrolase [Acidobacteriota bacterium]MYD72180.1 alpha/beta hydrolase [Acidobacteriota bacterium]MYJ02781.1 alpha/beta hydrolase [Acidobacteriota bacterium]
MVLPDQNRSSSMATEAVWEVPEPLSTCEVRLDAETVTTVRQHGNPSGPRVFVSHASGLATDLYYPYWSLLADDYDLMVYDLRNHGWNSVGPQWKHNVPTLIHDHDTILEAIDRVYGSKLTVGVFHSLTTIVALLSVNKFYSALVLFDPPLTRAGMSQREQLEAAERTAAAYRQRAHRFRKREDFVELLRMFPMFRRSVPGVRELMARTTLRRSASGEGYELRCPPEYEAQLMLYCRSFFPLLDLDLLECPTKFIGADPTIPHAYLPALDPRLASLVDYDFIPEATHMLPLEKPEECAALTREFLERHGLA